MRWKVKISVAGYSRSHLQEVQKLKRYQCNFNMYRYMKNCIAKYWSGRKRGTKIWKQLTSQLLWLLLSIKIGFTSFFMNGHDVVHQIWFQRIVWLKIALFCGSYLAYHPPKSQIYLLYIKFIPMWPVAIRPKYQIILIIWFLIGYLH